MELPDNIYEEIEELSEQGNVFSDQMKFDRAIEKWSQALELLPDLKVDWEAYTWLSSSIGDAFFLSGGYKEAFGILFDALNGPDGYGNPFIHYRLGQCQIKLGDEENGIQSLLKAYMLDGKEIFDDDSDGELYFQMLRNKGLIG